MKKKSLLTLLAVSAFVFAPSASAQTTGIGTLADALKTFVDKTPSALPFAADAGLDWSNAYIGQLIDTDFPFVHLGLGLSVGATTLPGTAVSPLVEAIGGTLDLKQVPLPFAVANARIGGLVLPFDIGLKVGFLPASLQKQGNLDLTYSNIGADFRYNLIKSDLLLPDVSVGAGVSVLKASVGYTVAGAGKTYTNPYNGDTLIIADPKLVMDFSAMTYEAKAQVSKTLLYLLTPYVGVSAMFGSAKSLAGVSTTVSTTGGTTLKQWSDYAGAPIDNLGFKLDKSVGSFGLKIYGGTSLNILIVKLDLQGMYNLTDGSIGGAVGVRAQL